MLKISAIILAVIAVPVLGILAYAATKPNTFRVERTTRIKAPPEKIFALITDFRAWGSWSSWERKDPAMKREFSGAANGTGAVYTWDGNRSIGKGRMEITGATPPDKVAIKLDFVKPLEAHNVAEFTLTTEGGATTVTWAMHGPNPIIGKVMSVFFNMDRMVGTEFETSLANLKAIAQQQAAR